MFDYYIYMAASGQKFKLSNILRDITIDETIQGTTTELYIGTSVRDILPEGIKRRVSISWKWLPHRDIDVLDNGAGFLTMLNLWRYNVNGGVLIFEKPNQDGTTETFPCYIDATSTTAEMQRRDAANPPANSLFWHLDLVLLEK